MACVRSTVMGLLAAMLVASCHKADAVTHEEPRVEPPAHETRDLLVLTGARLDDATLTALDGVSIGASSDVRGLVVAGRGHSEILAGARVGALSIAGDLQLAGGARIIGDVDVGGSVSNDAHATIEGTMRSGVGASPISMTWSNSERKDSQGDVTILPNEEGSLDPGTFDAVTVRNGGRLFLSTGAFRFRTFTVEPGARLVIDARQGPPFVEVRDALELRGQESSVDAGVPRLVVRYRGSADVVIRSPFSGVLFAPNAVVHLGDAHPTAPSFVHILARTVTIQTGEAVRPMNLESQATEALGIAFAR